MELTSVVVRVEPFQRTAAPARKFWPLMVSVNCGPAAAVVAGLIDDSVGDATLVTVKVTPLDVVLVPVGLMTVTLAEPTAAIRLAGTTAVNCVALTKVVESSPPFHTTEAPLAKLLPLMVSVNCAPPTVAEDGLSVVMAGVLAAPMVKAKAFDVVVPVSTVTFAVPALAMSVPETEACSCVALVTMVTSGLPFHCAMEPEVKPVPVTVRMKLGPPGAADDGESVVMLGPVGAAMENVSAPDVPDDGVMTVTLAVPALAMRLAATLAVSCVPVTKVVASKEPFHTIAEFAAKFEPFTVMVNDGPPGAAEEGLSEDSTGGGVADTVNTCAFDVRLPGLLTVMLTDAAAVMRLALTLAISCVGLM